MELTVNIDSVVAIDLAIDRLSLIKSHIGVAGVTTSPAVDTTSPAELGVNMLEDIVDDQDTGSDLDALLMGDIEDEVPAAPTVEDMKTAFQAATAAKGKDASLAFMQKVFAKLGVKNLSSIPEDKRESFLAIVAKFSQS